MKILFLVIPLFLFAMAGCSMFIAWKSIPPPGGCNQCHSKDISGDWKVAYQPVQIADERGRQAFQTPEYNLPPQKKPGSTLEITKEEDIKCFECHKSPTPEHLERKGRYHH